MTALDVTADLAEVRAMLAEARALRADAAASAAQAARAAEVAADAATDLARLIRDVADVKHREGYERGFADGRAGRDRLAAEARARQARAGFTVIAGGNAPKARQRPAKASPRKASGGAA